MGIFIPERVRHTGIFACQKMSIPGQTVWRIIRKRSLTFALGSLCREAAAGLAAE
jgi:hypothetical protein